MNSFTKMFLRGRVQFYKKKKIVPISQTIDIGNSVMGTHRPNVLISLTESKHLKACMGPAFVTVLDWRGFPMALR